MSGCFFLQKIDLFLMKNINEICRLLNINYIDFISRIDNCKKSLKNQYLYGYNLLKVYINLL